MKEFGLSIKTKLSLAFVSISLGVVTIYIFLAKGVFESDKIAYVFDTQQVQLQSLAKDFDSQVERMALLSRSILSAYDPATKELDFHGKNLFSRSGELLGLELVSEAQAHPVVLLEKPGLKIPSRFPEERFVKQGQLEVIPVDRDHLLLVTREASEGGDFFILRMFIKTPNVFPQADQQTYLMNLGQKNIQEKGASLENLPRLLEEIPLDAGTQILGEGKEKYLVSVTKTGFGKLSLVVVTPQKYALKALDTLYRKSIFFLIFTVVAVVLIAVILALGLTEKLGLLTDLALQVGQGKFDIPFTITSRDEVGVLSRAFKKMTVEIQRLVSETAEKARMQSELETAKAVQETLFPPQTSKAFEKLQITGRYRSASECGGDWWWYWTNGTRVFAIIADATGHGASAALLTSAARSAIAALEEKDNMALEDVVQTFHACIRKTALGKRTMSAFIVEYDLTSERIRYVNASHLPAVVLPREAKDLTWKDLQSLSTPLSPLIGGAANNFEIGEAELKPQERLVLLTDGLTERKDPAGKIPTERFFLRSLIDLHQKQPVDAEKFIELLFQSSDDFAKSAPQDDDLTVVVLDFKSD